MTTVPRPVAVQALAAVAYLVAGVLGGLTRLPSPPVAFVWPAAGVALLWFLLTPVRLRLRVAMPVLLALAYVANVVTGASEPTSAAFAVANVAHAVVGGTVFERLAPHTPRSLRDSRGLLAIGVASTAGALAGAPVLLAVLGPRDLGAALSIVVLWVPRFAASTAVVVALVLAWRAASEDRAAGRAVAVRSRWEVVAVLVVALGVHVWVYALARGEVYAFLTLPVTVLVGWRLTPAWTATYGAAAAALGVVATLLGRGPFVDVVPLTERTVVVQAFIGVAGLVGLALSLEVRQRHLALEAAHRRGDALELTRQSAVVPNALVSLEARSRGVVRYANPALRRWWGQDGTPDDAPGDAQDGAPHGGLVGRAWPDLLEPAERGRLAAVLDELAAGTRDAWEGQLEHRTASGERRACLVVAGVLLHEEQGDGRTERMANLQLVDVTDRTQLEARLTHQALHDQLTGLPNRVLLAERIAQALAAPARADATVAVLFLDLDHFKRVNDSLGHAAGDVVLQQVAERLVAAVRPGDTVARIGGDEFVVCCPDVADPEAGAALATRVARQVCRPVAVAGHDVTVGASIGLTLARPGADAGALLREADTAMYAAKADGRGRTAVFADVLFDRARRDLRLDDELRRALERQQFVLHFQPIVEIASTRVTAVEALLRWQHPERGLLLPGQWLAVAEQSGVMPALGRWALVEAFTQWPRIARTFGADVDVHVNVSAAQLGDGGFASVVTDALTGTGMDPGRVVLELTETHLLTIDRPLVDDLERLRALGVRLSVDDFGTGYSSLTQLTALPVDEVKIDRSFVAAMRTDARSRAVVEGVVAMARAMSLDLVAEGVETDEVAAVLSASGCRVAQGYLWGRPAALAA